jgi:hypothetical protein
MHVVHELSGGHALVALGWALFERHGLRAKLDLRTDAVLEFLTTAESGYRDVRPPASLPTHPHRRTHPMRGGASTRPRWAHVG